MFHEIMTRIFEGVLSVLTWAWQKHLNPITLPLDLQKKCPQGSVGLS